MRISLLFLFMIFFALAVSACGDGGPQHITVMSLNIRYNNPDDGLNAWPNRRQLVLQTLNSRNPDIIGFQEALQGQVEDLEQGLAGYGWYGVGRDDGKAQGEFAPVFYKKERFNLLDKGVFWLSAWPDSVGSIGWAAVLPRIATWLHLQDKRSGRELFAFNTHLSHVSDSARTASVRLIRKKVQEIAGHHPVIISGDFNFTHDSRAWSVITDTTNLPRGFRDSRVISKSPPEDCGQSFNGFGSAQEPRIIDYIFVNEFFRVESSRVLEIKRGELYISDHYPVITELSY